MLVSAGKIHHLADLGFCDLVGKHPHDSQPLLMHGQHDFKRLRMVQTKEPLQHMDHEFHRGEIVIQQKNLVQRRTLGFRLCLGDNPGFTIRLAGFVRRHVKW